MPQTTPTSVPSIGSRSVEINDLSQLKGIDYLLTDNLAVAQSRQLKGDHDSELHNLLLCRHSQYDNFDFVQVNKPMYMDTTSRTTHTIMCTGESYQSNDNSPVTIGPPCFSLINKFSVGEEVYVLPDKFVVSNLIDPDSISSKFQAIHDFYVLGKIPTRLIVLAIKFKVVEVIPPNKDTHHWERFVLSNTRVPNFTLPPSMMCRPTELVPFL